METKFLKTTGTQKKIKFSLNSTNSATQRKDQGWSLKTY